MAKDFVIRQDPAAGTELSEGDRVAIVTSTGPPEAEEIPLPDVTGQPADRGGDVPARPRLHERRTPTNGELLRRHRAGLGARAPTRPAVTRRRPSPTRTSPCSCPRGKDPATTTTTDAAHHDHAADHHHHRARRPRRPRATATAAAERPTGSAGGGRHPVEEGLQHRWPPTVRIDSGWNCTPSTSCSRWRRPITRPSSVSAVISSSGGHRGPVDDERVVAGGLERLGQAGEHARRPRGGSARSCRA